MDCFDPKRFKNLVFVRYEQILTDRYMIIPLLQFMGKSNSANNARSNSMNPNNASSKASADNRSNQMNSNNSASKPLVLVGITLIQNPMDSNLFL